MHHRAAIHDAMQFLTNQRRTTSEQHVDLSKSRRLRDACDLQKMLSWFADHDPFSDEIAELRSLSTGLTACDADGINCDDAEKIGAQIQASLDGISYNDAKIKRSQQVRMMQDLQPGVRIHDKTIKIDPSVLFLGCCAIGKRLDADIEKYLSHEMSTFPPALFKDGYMRKADKADLAQVVQKDMTNHISLEISPKPIVVIDGGWLVHRVRWKRGTSYADIMNDYVSYLEK